MTSAGAVRELGGIPIRISSPQEAALWVCEAARSRHSADIHLVNAYSLALADSNPEYRQVLRAGTNFPDGKPLAWVTRLSRKPLAQVRGPGLFSAVMDEGRAHDLRHFLLGTTDETLGLLRDELSRRFPGVVIAGTHSPPFRPLTEEEMQIQDEMIRASGADIVWVGLGTPKQDFETRRLAQSLPGLVLAVGAAFDFVAGTKKEAPSWMTSAGLEWLYRFGSEPRRLWRRYLLGNLRFLKTVVWPSRASDSTGA